MRPLLRGALVVLLAGCGSEDADGAAPQTDAAGSEVAVDVAQVALATIKVKVTYAGTEQGQIALGAFREPEPKTRPPVAFDTSKTPTFPYAGELRGLEPGKYWVVAVLDRAPYSSSAVKPGDEDLLVISEPVTVAGGELAVEVALPTPDARPDAGLDAGLDAASTD